jgi:hypothetical protein
MKPPQAANLGAHLVHPQERDSLSLLQEKLADRPGSCGANILPVLLGKNPPDELNGQQTTLQRAQRLTRFD